GRPPGRRDHRRAGSQRGAGDPGRPLGPPAFGELTRGAVRGTVAPAMPQRDPSPGTMLEARSVALVGASAREGSFGEQLLGTLSQGGFDGRIFPVNPNYPQIGDLPCYPSLGDLPERVDLAVLGVPNVHLEAQLRLAAKLG